MGELYKLNKDELIKIILNVRDNLTEQELENELRKKKDFRKLNILKKSLLNLKVVPHLTKIISEQEEFIKTRLNINDFHNLEFYNEMDKLRITKDSGSITISLREFILFDKHLDIQNDSVIYKPCKICDYYKVSLCINGIIRRGITSFGTSYHCPKHLQY